MKFEQIYEPRIKEKVVRKILEALPDWFAMEEGRICWLFMPEGDRKRYVRACGNGCFEGISQARYRQKNVYDGKGYCS